MVKHHNTIYRPLVARELLLHISESSLQTILNVGSLISDNKIRDTFKYCENNLQANGSIKKASK